MKSRKYILFVALTALLVTNKSITSNSVSFNDFGETKNKFNTKNLVLINQNKESEFYPGIVYVRVSGLDLNDLKKNLEDKTIRIMERANYRIKDAKFNSSNLSFSCTLIPDRTSSFFKIGLYFGPKANGYCESCSNVMRKNPGALEILKSQDNDYYYSFIAIPK